MLVKFKVFEDTLLQLRDISVRARIPADVAVQKAILLFINLWIRPPDTTVGFVDGDGRTNYMPIELWESSTTAPPDRELDADLSENMSGDLKYLVENGAAPNGDLLIARAVSIFEFAIRRKDSGMFLALITDRGYYKILNPLTIGAPKHHGNS